MIKRALINSFSFCGFFAWFVFAFPAAVVNAEDEIDVPDALFEDKSGPLIVFDAGHNNFHTLEGEYKALASVIENDGFRVESRHEVLFNNLTDRETVLVIANAVAKDNIDDWTLPTKSAFSLEEITHILDWVEKGGGLLLIADHIPAAGAAAELGEALGFLFGNGYAYRRGAANGGTITYSLQNKGLRQHPILTVHSKKDSITHVTVFTGQAFRLSSKSKAIPLLVLPQRTVLVLPQDGNADISNATPRIPADGMLQGAALEFGAGRVVVLADAGLFVARRRDGIGYGMLHPMADQNGIFAINIIRWLAQV